MHSNRHVAGTRLRGLVLVALVLGAALTRLLPHPANFTPVGAMALFGGAYFASRIAAIAVPLVAMLIADLALASIQGWSLGWMTAVIYGCIAGSSLIGITLRRRGGVLRIAAGSLLSALLFFLVTNFAVWAGTSLYSGDLAGLVQCYVAAVPYFGNTLAGYAIYGVALFGGFAALRQRFSELQEHPVAA
ncbi:MAG: hypothetical protein NXI31_02870 [bacterium]|nr:hypothetical protein [bacterium]